ncbi:HAAS signaling domain-containing protein [Cerasibacillus sp. JNUCC 74]
MSSSIKKYLNELSENLNELPNEEKEAILDEIEMHLKEKLNVLKKEGYSENEATNKILSEFKSPYSLSKDYLEEFDNADKKKRPSVSFFLLVIGLMGLPTLALPIRDNNLELAWLTLGIPQVMCGIITLFLVKRKDTFISGYFKVAPIILLSLCFPLSILFLWIAFNQNDGIVMFSLYYMLGYWLLLLIYYLVIKVASRKM